MTPGAGRRDGPQLTLPQINSRLVRELKAGHLLELAGGTQWDFSPKWNLPLCRHLAPTGTSHEQRLGHQRGRSTGAVCSQSGWLMDWSTRGSRSLESQCLQERLFSVEELSWGAGTLCTCAAASATKRGAVRFAPSQCTSWTHRSKGCKMRWIISDPLGANVKSEQCGPHSALRAWAGNLSSVIIVAQTEPPSWRNHRKGKKRSPTPSACSIQEDQQNPLSKLEVSRRIFCFSKWKAVRPELREDQRQIQKEVRWRTPTAETNFTLLPFRTWIFFSFSFLFFIYLLFN